MVSRRTFLQGLGTAAAAGAVSAYTSGASASLLPYVLGGSYVAGTGPYKVLEVFMVGGLSHRETFAVEPSYQGDPWRQNLVVDWANAVASGVSQYKPPQGPFSSLTQSFLPGLDVGPCCWPALQSDLINRMCIAHVQHDLTPHGPAQVVSLTGLPVGRPRAAGLAALVGRAGADGVFQTPGVAPHSYILNAAGVDVAERASLTGLLGTQHRPLVLRMGASNVVDRMDRAWVAAGDDALSFYDTSYRTALTLPSTAAPVRSRAYSAYRSALQWLDRLDAVRQLLNSFASTHALQDPLSFSGSETHTNNHTSHALRLGAHLLKESADARYVCVLDGGTLGSYDTHNTDPNHQDQHATIQQGNVWALLYTLRQLVDAQALNLNDTMVVINTDFGRIYLPGLAPGTEHWPYSYPVVMIGGPFGSRRSVGAVNYAGNIDRSVGKLHITTNLPPAEGPLSACDLRMFVALALGIWPFHPDAYHRDDSSVGWDMTPISPAPDQWLFGRLYDTFFV